MAEEVEDPRREAWERITSWPALGASFLFLIAYSVGILYVGQPPWLSTTLTVILIAVWLFFIVDFLVRLLLSHRKGHFVRRHPLALLSVILPLARPFLLLTGRGTVAQWHTETRTRQSPVLRKLGAPGAICEIHPADARRLQIRTQDSIRIESQRGSIQAKAFVTPTIAAGQVFLPMHDAATNQLTDATFDPYSRQPAYKSCAVRIERL